MTPRIVRAVLIWLAAALCLLHVGCYSMAPVAPGPDAPLLENPSAEQEAVFDRGAPAVVVSDFGRGGSFVLVRATLNVHHEGWFLLDSGASGCTITPEAAATAGLRTAGAAMLQGTMRTTVYEADTLGVGPLTLRGVRISGLSMHGAARAFGKPIEGILGRNVFANAVVEMDVPRRSVRLLPPGSDAAVQPEAWTPLEIRRGLPHVRASFGPVAAGGLAEGWFMLDTGADDGVHFTAECAAAHRLRESPGLAVRGSLQLQDIERRQRVDTAVLSRLVLGGVEVHDRPATLGRVQSDAPGVLRDADGRLGMLAFQDTRIVIDMPGGRAAFPRSAGEGK